MNNIQRLGIVHALKKELDCMESDLKAEVAETLPDEGGNANIVFNGSKVGTVTKTQPTLKPQIDRDEVVVDDLGALDDWAAGCERLLLEEFALIHPEEFGEFALTVTGELPKGCSLKHVVVPETYKPGHISVRGATFEKVNGALNGLTQSTLNLLLEEYRD